MTAPETSPPDFHLRIFEGFCNSSWCCWCVKRVAFTSYDDGLLLRIDPALTGGECGSYGFNTPYLLISPHFQGDILFPLPDLPLHVYVFAISIENPQEREYLAGAEIKKIGFGVIFRSGQENKSPSISAGYSRPDALRSPAREQ